MVHFVFLNGERTPGKGRSCGLLAVELAGEYLRLSDSRRLLVVLFEGPGNTFPTEMKFSEIIGRMSGVNCAFVEPSVIYDPAIMHSPCC